LAARINWLMTYSGAVLRSPLPANFSIDEGSGRREADGPGDGHPGGPSMTTFPPIAHVALTVRDLEASVPWYTELFEDQPVLDEDTGPFRHVVWMVSGTLVGLHQFPDTDVTTPFSERRAGLDHVASASRTSPSWSVGRSA